MGYWDYFKGTLRDYHTDLPAKAQKGSLVRLLGTLGTLGV